MKKQAKQFTSLLCVLVLCLTLLPVSALASGLEGPGTPKSTPTASMSPEPSVEPSPEPTPEESTEPEPVDSAEPTPVPTETPAPENEAELFADEEQTEFYVGGEGASDEDGDGTQKNPYATLAKVAEHINQQEYGGTYFIYVMDDITSTACARFYDCHVTITSGEGGPYTVTRGADFSQQNEPARQWYNPAMLEIGKAATDENDNFLWEGTSRLTLENIVFDDNGLHEGEYFLQAGIEDLPDEANSQNIVQDAIIATYNGTADIILGEGAILKNYGGMSAIRASGGTITMKSGSAIYDDSNVVADREKGASGSFGPAGAIWLQGGELTMEEGSEIRDMVGRAVYADGGKAIINGTIKNIKGDPDMWFAMNGIAIHIRGGADVTIGTTGLISDIAGTNTQSAQSAIIADGSGSLAVEENGKIANCHDLHHIIYYNGSEPFEMKGIITNCVAKNNGTSTEDTYIVALGYGTVTMNLHATGSINNNEAGIATIYVVNNGTVNIYGEITRNKGGQTGGVSLYNHGASTPVANLYEGGKITDNTGSYRGGGIIASQNTRFNMYGGEISGNTAPTGAGVYVRKNGQFVMTGGKITNNMGPGISYETTSSDAPYSYIRISDGEISGNKTAEISITNAYAQDGYSCIQLNEDVLRESYIVKTSFGTLTLDQNYPAISIGNAKSAAQTGIKGALRSGADWEGWDAVGSSALWFKPTTDSFHFTMPKSYSVENGRGLYAGYIPLKTDGTPADDAALTVVPVENEAILDITVSDLTPDTSYALMLIHSNEYTIKPDDITIYTGGETEGGLPEPTIINSTPDIDTITINEQNFEIDDISTLFVIQYQDGTGKELENDHVPGTYVAKIALSESAPEGLEQSENGQIVGLKINGNTVRIANGTLTIRYVSDVEDAHENALTTPVVGKEDHVSVTDKGIALIEGTPTYYTNGEASGLGETAEDAQIALLFDDLLPASLGGGDREQMLVAEAESQGHSIQNRSYEFKYLDLVDVSNGNAWVSTDSEITIYWPLPEGTGESTEFELLHFTGLHREYGQLYNEDELAQQIADSEVVAVEVENTDSAVKFTLDGNAETGSFSPFALVWGEVQEPDPTPEPEPTPDPEPSDPGSSSGGSTSVRRYNIEADAGRGGEISPDGRVRVRRGENQTFRITPDEGYEIYDVIVDGESVGAVERYTFENVREDHTISVTFRLIQEEVDTGVSRWLNTEDHIAYLQGYPGGLFGPDDNMTRAEAAQMFYNLLLEQDVASTVSFTDVAPDAWYADAVNALASLGMVEGVGGGLFAPERTITRAEFTVIAMRFAYLPEGGENPFSDVAEDDWFYDQVVGAVQYGWITGYPDGTFGPEDTITRAEVTATVNRMLNRQADEDYVDSHAAELIQFTDLSPAYWAYYDIMEAANGHTYETDGDTEIWTGIR